jgi:hypothetical protein
MTLVALNISYPGNKVSIVVNFSVSIFIKQPCDNIKIHSLSHPIHVFFVCGFRAGHAGFYSNLGLIRAERLSCAGRSALPKGGGWWDGACYCAQNGPCVCMRRTCVFEDVYRLAAHHESSITEYSVNSCNNTD